MMSYFWQRRMASVRKTLGQLDSAVRGCFGLRQKGRQGLVLCLALWPAACGVPFVPYISYAAKQVELPERDWQFEGMPKGWDKDQLYRGYTVATQVCLACHSFKYISHRDLMRVGFTEDEVRALADELGMGMDDKLMSGLDAATAKDVYGKAVPDLSLMNKARPGLADYTYALLVGYSEDEKVIRKYFPEGPPQNGYFNKYYPGHAIAMPNPLPGPDLVTYHDDTSATVPQMAADVTYFMQFTAEPELMERKTLGIYVLLYLLVFTILAFFTMRAIWADVKKGKHGEN